MAGEAPVGGGAAHVGDGGERGAGVGGCVVVSLGAGGVGARIWLGGLAVVREWAGSKGAYLGGLRVVRCATVTVVHGLVGLLLVLRSDWWGV